MPCTAPFKLAVAALACALGLSATLSLAWASEAADNKADQAEEDAAVLPAWETNLPCTACHTNEAETLEIEERLASKHAALPCNTCHNDGEVLQEAHDNPGKRMPTKLKKTDVLDEVCLSCHGDDAPLAALLLADDESERAEDEGKDAPAEKAETVAKPVEADDKEVEEASEDVGSTKALAETTAQSTVLTDKHGTVCNPHALPQNSSHDTIACVSCHKVHDDVTLERRSELTCLNCHHDEVYECGTCHAH